MKVSVASAMIMAYLCASTEAIKVNTMTQTDAEWGFNFSNVVDQAKDKFQDVQDNAGDLKDQMEAKAQEAAATAANLQAQANEAMRQAEAQKAAVEAQIAKAQAIKDGGLDGAMQTAMGKAEEITGNDQISKIGDQVVKTGTAAASGDIQGAIATGVQGNAQLEELNKNAGQVVKQVQAGDMTQAATIVSDQAAAKVGGDNGMALKKNMDGLIGFADAVEKKDTQAALNTAATTFVDPATMTAVENKVNQTVQKVQPLQAQATTAIKAAETALATASASTPADLIKKVPAPEITLPAAPSLDSIKQDAEIQKLTSMLQALE